MDESRKTRDTEPAGVEKSVAIAPSRPFLNRDGEHEREERIHLRDYLRMVRKHLWLVAGVATLVPMLTAVYLARKPDIYVAQALLQVDVDEVNPALLNTKTSSVILNNSANDPAYFNTQLRILSSPGLLRRVARTLDLEHAPDFLQGRTIRQGATWRGLLQTVGLNQKTETEKKTHESVPLTGPIVPATVREDLTEAERLAPYVKELSENFQADPVVEKRLGYGRDVTRLIEIRYTNRDPRLAARIVNTIADVHALANLERKAEKNVTTGDFLQKRIAELQAQIRSGEERLINYAKSNQILSLDAGQNTVVERLVGLNRQLLEAENERKLAETAYQAASMPGAALALAEENTGRQTADLKTRLAELRQRRAQLLVENTERWPEVQEITQQIGVVEKEIETARHRSIDVILANLQTRHRQAVAREQALRAAFDTQRSETLTQNEAAINYRIIQQEIETNKGLLNGLLQSYKENDVVLAGVYNNVHIIDYAIAPDKPIGPRRLQGIILAFFFSFPAGIGLAIFLEYLDNSISSADDVEKALRLPALVAIPTAKELRQEHGNPESLFKVAAHSSLAEAYRQLRTSVLLSTTGRAPKTLLITSSLPSEGKTTTAVNLAISLAQSPDKVKVLIIDADLRRPRLRSLFGLRRSRGLSTYLSSEMSDDELITTLIDHHQSSNLSILTAGPVPPNPAELLGSERMRRLISILERDFTYIIIDSAPAASLTDAVLLSPMVDGVLLVVRSGMTSREIVQRARQMLLGAGAKILGVVLNQIGSRAAEYYYRDYKQNYYRPDPEVDQFTAAAVEDPTKRIVGSDLEAAPDVTPDAPPGVLPNVREDWEEQVPPDQRSERNHDAASAAFDSGFVKNGERPVVIESWASIQETIVRRLRKTIRGASHQLFALFSRWLGLLPRHSFDRRSQNQSDGDVHADFDHSDVAPSTAMSARGAGVAVREGATSAPVAVDPDDRNSLISLRRESGSESFAAGPVIAAPPIGPGMGFNSQALELAKIGGLQFRHGTLGNHAVITAGPPRIDEEAGLGAICAAFDDPDPQVRNAAVRAMFNDDRDGVAILTRVLREAPEERRRRIGSAIASSGLVEMALDDLAGGNHDQTHQASLLLFLMIKAGETQPLLQAIEEYPKTDVRVAVVKLLALSRRAELLPELLRLAADHSLPTVIYAELMEAIYQMRCIDR